MTEKNLVNEGKEERQKTMDKLSIESGKAYTYEKEEEGSGCLSDAQKAREKAQEKLDQ
jgi:hypothetical protein